METRSIERVMIFIDGSNFWHGLVGILGEDARLGTNIRLDYRAFFDRLVGPQRRPIQAHYYVIQLRQADNPARYAGQQRFFSYLERLPHVSLHRGRVVNRSRERECPFCHHAYVHEYQIEKGVDVQLAVHMLAAAYDNLFDIAILVSNDGDFAPAVVEVQRLRKRVENADFPNRLPSFLSRQCNSTIRLTREFLEPCLRPREQP